MPPTIARAILFPTRLEEARRRKLDYATYYGFALRYGPLAEEEFELVTYPGESYHARVSDACRLVQYWWWSVWPPVLRCRKAAALQIQASFRGLLQRKKWRAIIRLRALWGNTRIVAHSFTCWRDIVAKIRRVKAFTRRFRSRCKGRCYAALAKHAKQEKKLREDVVRERLRRLSQGIRFRVFDAWVTYTETSVAVKRMHLRSLVRPVFRAWWTTALAARRQCRLRWACATLVRRFISWRHRARYSDVRTACIKLQGVARVKSARARVKKDMHNARLRRAEEVIQALEVGKQSYYAHKIT